MSGLVAALSVALALAPAGPAIADEQATTAPYGVGDRIASFTLENQHGDAAAVDATTRVVLFSRDMEGGDLLKAALADVPQADLEARGAVYVSDISGMPGIVARLFAVPAMRRRPYAMLLDREGETTARLPDEAGRATLVHLSDLRIERIVYAVDADAVRAGLGLDADIAP